MSSSCSLTRIVPTAYGHGNRKEVSMSRRALATITRAMALLAPAVNAARDLLAKVERPK